MNSSDLNASKMQNFKNPHMAYLSKYSKEMAVSEPIKMEGLVPGEPAAQDEEDDEETESDEASNMSDAVMASGAMEPATPAPFTRSFGGKTTPTTPAVVPSASPVEQEQARKRSLCASSRR